MRLIAGHQATRKPARANPYTPGSAPSACVLACSLYIHRLCITVSQHADMIRYFALRALQPPPEDWLRLSTF